MQSDPSSNIKSSVYVALIGLAAASWPLMGYDSVAHLIEETKSADAVAGRCMPWALVASFFTGLIYILTLTLCIQVSYLSQVKFHHLSNAIGAYVVQSDGLSVTLLNNQVINQG